MSSHAAAAVRSEALDARPSWAQRDPLSQADIDRLSDRIAELSAHIQAATYRLLVLIRRFDEAEGWHRAGFTSCASWLSWRTGVGPGASREKVRVARALADLPELSRALKRGELSYSAARAITRVATPGNEAELVEVARQATAAELERLVRAWRGAKRAEEEARATEAARHADRRLSVVADGEGGWRVSGRLDPDAGAVLRAALEAAEEALFRGGADDRDAPAGARQADALGLVAEAALGEGLGAGEAEDDGKDGSTGASETDADPSPDAPEADEEADELAPAPVVGRAGCFEVVVHVDAETLAGGNVSAETSRRASLNGRRSGARLARDGVPPGPPHVAGGPALSPATARRLACDAGIVGMVHGGDGRVLDVGRRTRSVPPAMRRALDHRDRGGRFPGCGSRFCDAHHLVPWAEGGATRLDHLVLLCRRHHRRVHEDGWRIELADGEATADGRPAVRVRGPDGTPLPPVPGRAGAPELPDDPVVALERRHRGLGVDAWTATPDGHGPPMDLDFALFTLMPPLERDGRAATGK